MNITKKLVKFLLTGLFALLVTSAQVFSKPVSLQFFAKNEGGLVKKIAIVGIKHEQTPAENDFFNASKEIITNVTQSYNAQRAYNRRPIDVLIESPNFKEYSETVTALNTKYPDLNIMIEFETQLAFFLYQHHGQTPFVMHQADIRETSPNAPDFITNSNFLSKILNSQDQNNKTILFCGNNHIFGCIENILPLLGYQRYFWHGVFTVATMENSVSNDSEVIVEMERNAITVPMYRWMLIDFLTQP